MGVYVLEGTLLESEVDRAAYVGEGVFRQRTLDHTKEGSNVDKSMSWDTAYVFTSPDFHRGFVKWLELSVLEALEATPLLSLVNGNRPPGDSLESMDRVNARAFLEEILMLLPVLGSRVLEQSVERPKAPPEDISGVVTSSPEGAPLFRHTQPGVRAQMVVDPDGMYRILAGSRLVAGDFSKKAKLAKSTLASREKLITNGVLVASADGTLFLNEDVRLRSANALCTFVVGNMHDVRRSWVTKDGLTLADYESDANPVESPSV